MKYTKKNKKVLDDYLAEVVKQPLHIRRKWMEICVRRIFPELYDMRGSRFGSKKRSKSKKKLKK